MRLWLFILACIVLLAAASPATQAAIDNAYIVQLSQGSTQSNPPDQLAEFHKRASSLTYTVRHQYTNVAVFNGLSIQVKGNLTRDEVHRQLQGLVGVVSISPVIRVQIPSQPGVLNMTAPLLSYPESKPKPQVTYGGNLGKALEMGGVDKLHAMGIKGKGIKIGVVDTGVDYRHPALGAGFGPGHKIAGGFAFVTDNGTVGNFPDPLATCYGGGHGTHVAGILGMDNDTFQISGVAPDASIFMYRVFDCEGSAGSDTIIAAMSKAHEDGMAIVSMSLGLGAASFDGGIDPVAEVTKRLTDEGVAVIVAQSNDVTDAAETTYTSDLYTEEWPSTEPTAISIGAISNEEFPVVYHAIDNLGNIISYASVYPLNLPSAKVYMLSSGCDAQAWIQGLSSITNINQTVFAFQVTEGCSGTSAGSWRGSHTPPTYIMAINTDGTTPYKSDYDTPSQGFYGTTQFININAADGIILSAGYEKTGGYGGYKLNFTDTSFIGMPQVTGGLIDYYSSFGPTWHDYNMKPQIAAPGGHVLSTWPLGPLGGYAILSGTSMATPYIAGCFALLKSQLPNASNNEILRRLQTTAQPVPWAFNRGILSATAQQGAGLVNVYRALMSESLVSPGQIKVSDVSRTEYGTAKISIQNTSPTTKVYTLNHQGAGYMDYYLEFEEKSQLAIYGTANFSTPTVTIPSGGSATVDLTFIPPTNVIPSQLPVYGGFIKIASDNESFSIPYLGPPYSIWNTPYLLVTTAAESGVQLPEIYAYNADQSEITYDTNLLEIVPSYGYGSSIPTIQWTKHIRLDVLPANTNITAHHYGFDRNVTWDYIPSRSIPNETIFGHDSFGVLENLTGYLWPRGNSPSASDDRVTASDNIRYGVGTGDYRWFASVLRWGGTMGVEEDYDTWLGPIVRFVDQLSGNVSKTMQV